MRKLRPPLVTMDEKLSCMLEHPMHLELATAQVGTISREVEPNPSETIRRAPAHKGTMREEIMAYLRGALGDASYSGLHRTWRYSQSDRRWLMRLKSLLKKIGYRSWLYREGRKRRVYVLETTAKFLSVKIRPITLVKQAEKIAFVRGFFDAEGGVPRNSKMRFYVQFSQKNFEVLSYVRKILEEVGIKCGRIHNPSAKIDPDYWRFFVRAQSYRDFVETIGSMHPRKEKLLWSRMKI